MDEKLFMEIMNKYSQTINWLKPKDPTNIQDLLEYDKILKLAKQHTLDTMNCTQDKFHDVVELMIPQKEDRPILECYYSFLDNIRKAHQ